ncbi:hypothetical protein PMIN04_004090 [Paraphaeosphaeria minitans]
MPDMSLFGEIVREGVQLFTKSVDLQLKDGDHVLVEFGREKTPEYIFYQNIPVTAKLLIHLNKLPPLKRRIALPTVAKFVWDMYLDWMKNDYDIVKAAYTYTWGQIFLLAHTSKVLQDDHSHSMSLSALLKRGESVNHQIEGMFSMSEWQLVRNTVKAGAAQDDRTRDTIRRLFHECPLLFDHMVIEHGATEQELHEIGLKYTDTYEIKDIQLGVGAFTWDSVSVFGRPPLPIAGPSPIFESTGKIPQISGVNGLGIAMSGNGTDEAAASNLPAQATDQHEPFVDEFGTELRGNEAKIHDEGWEIASISSLESYGNDSQNDSDEQDPMENEPTPANVSSQPAEDLADHLAHLAVQEVAAVEKKEEQAASQEEDCFSDKGEIAFLQEELVVSLQADSVADCSLQHIASDEDGVALHQEDSAVNQEADEFVDGPPEDTNVSQETGQSHDPSGSPAVATENEMMAALAKIPGLESSKWASYRDEKAPKALVAEINAALTESINAIDNSEHADIGYEGEADVIRSAVVQSEDEPVSTPVEQQQRSSGRQSPVDLPQAASEAQSDAEDVENPEDAQEAEKFSDAENALGVERAQEAEDVSGAEDQEDTEDAEAALDAEYIAGFVPTHNLPRTVPGTPAEDEMGTMENREPSYEERRKHACSLLGKKRLGSDMGETRDRRAKHMRHEGRVVHQSRHAGRVIKQPTRKYGNSALHALREKQAASTTAHRETSQREEPIRQPKGPPASGKEMADDKARDPKAWPQNFAVGAPPRSKGLSRENIASSPEDGSHLADRVD